jgi:hypothetical protein
MSILLFWLLIAMLISYREGDSGTDDTEDDDF